MQETTSRESSCSKTFCAVTNITDEVQKYLAFPIRCKSWDCPKCRKLKAKQYRDRASRLKDLDNLHLYTFTYFHFLPPDEAWKGYNAAWNRFRTAVSRRHGKFNYIRVLESHKKSAYPHIHVIADVKLMPTELNKLSINAGFGYQVDMKPITTDGALAYVLKYLSKEWANEEGWFLRRKYRCRIITFSTGLLSPVLRGSNWNALLVGTDLETCIEHIRTDFQWRTDAKAAIVGEWNRDDHYSVHVVWRKVPDGYYRRTDLERDPPGYVPK